MMRLFIYNLILAVLVPPARWWLRRHAVYAPLLARFSPPVPLGREGAIWVQVCSLGEANAARPLIEAIAEGLPNSPVLVTSSTLAGHARCLALYGAGNVTWFPFDTRPAVKNFLASARPAALILFETELWPNVLSECRRAGVPVLLANGRLSEKNKRRYARLRWWYGPLLQHIGAACMQDEIHAERIRALGMPPERIAITGSVKFDAVQDAVPIRERNRMRQQWGIREGDPILLFATTRPGEEALASACWSTLKEEIPRLKLIIAPRHLERMEEVLAPFSEPVARRTATGNSQEGARVFILDTMGELGSLYAIASVVVVGGSFYPGVNGHNPLEAAALGIPTVFGPYMSNCPDAVRVLVDAGGAIQVPCPEDLYLTLSRLLADPGRQRQMGTAARRAVMANRGAAAKTVAHIKAALES